MAVYSNIDIETFKWVSREVESTLNSAEKDLQNYVSTEDKSILFGLSTQLHQVVGSLQMLEMKSVSALMMESELLVEDMSSADSTIGKSSFVVLVESAFQALRGTFSRIEKGLPENPIDVVELINQVRSLRGLDDIEISSLFSPMIEVFPEVDSSKALKDEEYMRRVVALRAHYQSFLLGWLRNSDKTAIDKMIMIFEKLHHMSAFGVVARLWWVATAYSDYVKHNDPDNRSVHSKIFRQLDDRFRDLEKQGESALVRDPGDELVKIMLFYTGVGEKRTERMDQIVDSFKLYEYFPALKLETSAVDFDVIEENLVRLKEEQELPLSLIRQLVTNFFEQEQKDSSGLKEISTQVALLHTQTQGRSLGVVSDVVSEVKNVVDGLEKGVVQRDEDTAFHLASALIFVENSVNRPADCDVDWLQNGQLKHRALAALSSQEALTEDMDGAHLTGGERQALLDVVGSEVEENLKEIEEKLEQFSKDRSKRELLAGIDGKVRQIRGALQVLGEQKVGLLLKMAEEQFTAIEAGETEASPAMVEALAIAIGTMEEYVRGLQNNRSGMDYLLDRSITDLEVAIGKKVSRDDVEQLLDEATGSLFSWLGNQSDFELFNKLKSTLRDLNILAKKTGLIDVENLVREQDRLIDVISQEPAFLTDNITANLQNNMVSITEQIITLYGTEESEAERLIDAQAALERSAIKADDDDDQRFYDDMDISELGEDLAEPDENLNVTEIAKQHAAAEPDVPEVDEAILEVFLEESVEVLEEANIQHKICSKDVADREASRELRRAFHTLKGSARMVGLTNAGEVAWFAESLFNYVLDTEKPLTNGILGFARDALDEFEVQVDNNYQSQHLIDVDAWGAKTEAVDLDQDVAVVESGRPASIDVEPKAEQDVDVVEQVEETKEEEPEAEAEYQEHESISLVGDEISEGIEEAADSEPPLSEETIQMLDDGYTEEPSVRIDDVDFDELVDSADETETLTLEGDDFSVQELDDDLVETETETETELSEVDLDEVDLDDIELSVSEEQDSDPLELIELDDDGVELEAVSEIIIEEDSSFEFDGFSDRLDSQSIVEQASSSEANELDDIYEHGIEEQSFSIIHNPEMREVFANEAMQNLEKLDAELKQDSLVVVPDDVVSISIHTLLGNARTLGITDIADAYDAAENLCMLKQQSGLPLDEQAKLSLATLIEISRRAIYEEVQQEPYYKTDSDEWAFITKELQKCCDQESELIGLPNIESDAADVSLNDEILLDLQDIDLDLGVQSLDLDDELDLSIGTDGADDLIELELTDDAEDLITTPDVDVEKEGADSPAERVASVIDGIEPIDDLVAPADDAVTEASTDSDELDELELSLQAFKEDQAEEDTVSDVDDSESLQAAESIEVSEIDDISIDDLLIGDDEHDVGEAVSEVIDDAGVDDAQLNEPLEEIVATDEPEELVLEEELVEDVTAEEPSVEEPLIEETSMVEEESVQEQGDEVRESLIPDELTDLLEDDVLEPSALLDITDDSSDFEQEQEQDTSDDFDEQPDVAELVQSDDADQQDDEDDELAVELRGVFIEEMRGLQHELDDEVANLTSLGEMAPVMANVMRHLHTIKGSALMAEASALGNLTHQTETYLETNFIRNEEDLRGVRTTLELFVDALDTATGNYQARQEFTPPQALLSALGASEAEDSAVPMSVEPVEVEAVAPEPNLGVLEIIENTTEINEAINKIQVSWKSARGWKKVQPQLQQQLAKLNDLVSEAELDDAALTSSLTAAGSYIDGLSLKKVKEFKASKALLEEAFDVIVSGINSAAQGDNVDVPTALLAKLNNEEKEPEALDDDASENESGVLSSAKKVDAAIFVPGSTELTETEQKDLDRQKKAALDRAAALRINTDTLDSLTNFVGDASMNRSQMREDVLSIKSVIDDLYSNVQRFNTQLRELEIEADSKITSRTNEAFKADSGEFDPLEMDRYTKLQQLSRGLAENLDELGGIQNTLNGFVYKAETNLQKQERLNRELQDEIMQVRLVSFGGVGPQLRQVVRRTARELDKDVELEIIGADVRLDKTILDGVVPALEHMLRNAVDHGIESSQERSKTKKPKVGKVTIECRQVAREIVISVADDGKGLDVERIREKAIADNLLAEDQPLNPEDIMMYISQSGFSTASKLTQISGRGVGMDVVQTTLRRMSGSIAYDLENDKPGSQFVIRLPISLAVSSAMFIRSGGEIFAIAARTIERVVNIDAEELIGYLKVDKPRIDVAGQTYSLIDLADYLGYSSQLAMLSGKISVVLVNSGVQNIAVIVEELLDTQEIVVKNLGEHLGRIPIYAGATIRANGAVVLLLDLVGISYYESFVSIPEQSASLSQAIPMVMVVDDSLTVRKSAERDINGLGINSVLAKDGLDAQVQLRQEAPDMILLDIEMPRMDGFELLEWVKSQDDLKHIPVVMISSRATEKYVDKASKLGCAAFLGKPYLIDSLVELFNQYLELDAPIEVGE